MNYFDNCKVKFLNIKGQDIPDDLYFKLPGISNSRLKYIDPLEEGSPQLYKDPPRKPNDPSLKLGSAVHCLFLQNDDYVLSDYNNKPSAKLGFFIDCLYKYRKQNKPLAEAINLASVEANYYVGKLTKNRLKNVLNQGLDYYKRKMNGEFDTKDNKEVIVLPANQLESCKNCLKSLYKDSKVKTFLSENLYKPKIFLNEIALFSDMEITFPNGDRIVLPFKGKLDQVIIDPEKKLIYLNDLKTTSKPCEMFMGGIYDGEWFNGSFIKLHYMRQFSIYLLLLQMYCEQILGLTDYDYLCNVIVVETTGSNRARVYPINNSYIQYGIKEFKELICRVAFLELYGYEQDIEERISEFG